MTTAQTRLSPLACAIASLSLLAVALPAASMEEIISTARGRQENLQDVPAAVSVITEQQIQQQGITRPEDFVTLVPGMTIVDAAEAGDTQVNIRGINGARDAEVNYALVVDGIVKTNGAALNREWSNLSQIEVLKGPQGALYGRNAAAGAIILNTRRPTEALEGDLRASYGEDETYSIAGRIGGVTSNDVFAWQLNGDFGTSDGFYFDSFNQRDDVIDAHEDWNLDGRLIWNASDSLTIDTKLRYGEVDASSITFNSIFHIPSLPGVLEGLGIPADVAAGGNEDVNAHPFQFNPNVESFNNQEALEFSVKADADLGFADFVGWFLYSDIENNLGADGTSGAFGFFASDPRCIATTTAVANSGFMLGAPQVLVPGAPEFSVYGAYTPTSCDGTQYQERNQEDFSVELRLRSKDDERLRWEGGLYFLTIEREVGVNLGIDNAGIIIPELFTTNPLNPTEQLVHDQFDTDVYSVFGQVAYDFTDTIEGSLALRYDREERDVENLVPTDAVTQYIDCDGGSAFGGFDGGDPINPGLCLDPTGASADQSRTFDQIQPKVSVRWNATDALTAFASAGVGFKSGGFNNFGSQATVDQFINGVAVMGTAFDPVAISDTYDEETSTSYEVGFKHDISDDFRWEGAAYYIDIEDQQFFEFFVGQFGLLRVVSNIDEANMRGIELGATWDATEWASLYINGNYIDTEIDANSSRPDSVGNELPYTPDYTFALGGDFRWPIGDGLDLIANLALNGVGDTWFHVIQDQQRPTIFDPAFGTTGADLGTTRRDAYELLDVRIGVQGGNWKVVLVGTNVTDEDYLEEVIPAPEFGGTFAHPGTQARWGIEGSVAF